MGGLTHGIPFLLYIRYPPSFLFELLDNLSKSCFLVLCPGKDKKRAFMLLHINALTLFYYKIVLAVVPYKLEFDALLMLLNPINSILYKFDKWFTGQILGSVCRNDTADFSLAIGVNPYSRLNAVL